MKITKKDYNNKLEQLKRGLTFSEDCFAKEKEIAYNFKVWKKEEEKFNYTHELPEEIKGGFDRKKLIQKL